MKCCISFGRLDKNLYILLLAALFRILTTCIYGINSLEYYEEKSISFSQSALKEHILLQSIMRFFGITVLSFLSYQYKDQKTDNNLQNMNDDILDDIEKFDNFVSKKSKSKFQPDNTKFKYIVLISLIGFFLAFIELTAQFYNLVAPKDTDYWTLEILFNAFFMKKIFKTKLYIHQIFSMCFIAIVGSLMKLLTSIANNGQFNLNQIYIPICYLFILIIKSYIYSKIKWLMDIRYFSISIVLCVYGLFGFLISLVMCILTNIFPSTIFEAYRNYASENETINFVYIIREIILIIVYMLLSFFTKYYYMLTLRTFSPIHVLANNSLYYLFIQSLLIIKNYNNNQTIFYYVLSNIFSISGYVVYVELIELKFCGCDYNLKKNITKRSRSDAIESIKLNKINLSGEKIQTDGTESDLSEETSFYSDLSDY